MQVVIDVPDKVYEMVMNTGTYGCYRFNSTKAIREGVPLDNIRAEIDNALSDGMIHKKTVLGIIDKYKAESEGTDGNSNRYS